MLGPSARVSLCCILVGLSSSAALATDSSSDPSFDCAKATHEIEQLICSDVELAAEDRALAAAYAGATGRVSGEPLSSLRVEQRGWTKGRNDCWKAEDQRACALDATRRRRALLQARYGLVLVPDAVVFACLVEDAPEPTDAGPTTLLVTFVATDPPAVNLVRGKEAETAVGVPSASGARYMGDFGISFWTKGDEAMLEWPEGRRFDCKRQGNDAP